MVVRGLRRARGAIDRSQNRQSDKLIKRGESNLNCEEKRAPSKINAGASLKKVFCNFKFSIEYSIKKGRRLALIFFGIDIKAQIFDKKSAIFKISVADSIAEFHWIFNSSTLECLFQQQKYGWGINRFGQCNAAFYILNRHFFMSQNQFTGCQMHLLDRKMKRSGQRRVWKLLFVDIFTIIQEKSNDRIMAKYTGSMQGTLRKY